VPSIQALTHPVVCGSKLYIRHEYYLYCYDIGRGDYSLLEMDAASCKKMDVMKITELE
jgi:hypothetical protein